MIKRNIIYKTKALVFLALLFLYVTPAFSQSLEVDYLCELGKTFYIQGKTDEALQSLPRFFQSNRTTNKPKSTLIKYLMGIWAIKMTG